MYGCATYATYYPYCDCLNGDFNRDVQVNTFDALSGVNGRPAISTRSWRPRATRAATSSLADDGFLKRRDCLPVRL